MSSLGKLGAAVGLLAVVALAAKQKSTGEAAGGRGGAVGDIPAEYVALYRESGSVCPRLDWALLAGIGKVESDHGRARLPGVKSGANGAGAKGPMQFLGPTFAGVRARHPEVGPDVYDPTDAVPAAAHYLCDSGLRDGNEYRAIWAYNHADWYVAKVRAQAAVYRAAA